ncbi:MAG: hypothetical protein M3Z16_01740 [Pseudomonadota bacterium]|nr:hypothetical protein [Pseudomonadota bacterium]
MIKSKLLTDSAWKDVLAKNKGVKDNGMLKALADIKKLGDDDHDDAQKLLDEIVKLSGQLKKSKEIAAAPAVSKFLAELSGAADTAMRDVAKAKAEAQKTSKAQAEAKKREEEAGKKDEDGEEDEESSELLTTKMVPLLRQVNKGEMMHVLIARAGKQVAVMMSRKPIAPARRKILADELGVTGGVKYFGGHCVKEDGATMFVLKSEVTGLAKLLKLALLNQTGLRVKKLSCRGEDGEDADHDEGDDLEAGGREGGETPEATRAKEPSPELVQAPEAWDGARELLATNIGALKKAVRAQLSGEGDDYVDEIDGHLEKLDRIFGRLDRRLSTSLASAAATRDAAERNSALGKSKGLLAEYIRYVQSEPLIDHVDKNPFGVKTELKATLSKSLTQLARALG